MHCNVGTTAHASVFPPFILLTWANVQAFALCGCSSGKMVAFTSEPIAMVEKVKESENDCGAIAIFPSSKCFRYGGCTWCFSSSSVNAGDRRHRSQCVRILRKAFVQTRHTDYLSTRVRYMNSDKNWTRCRCAHLWWVTATVFFAPKLMCIEVDVEFRICTCIYNVQCK